MARHERCDEGQGFYFSRPLPEHEIQGFLVRHRQEFMRGAAARSDRNVVSLTR